MTKQTEDKHLAAILNMRTPPKRATAAAKMAHTFAKAHKVDSEGAALIGGALVRQIENGTLDASTADLAMTLTADWKAAALDAITLDNERNPIAAGQAPAGPSMAELAAIKHGTDMNGKPTNTNPFKPGSMAAMAWDKHNGGAA
jgi:predicted secreted protein